MKKIEKIVYDDDIPATVYNCIDWINTLVDAVNHIIGHTCQGEDDKHPPKEPECKCFEGVIYLPCPIHGEKPTKTDEPHIHKYPRHTVDKCYCKDGETDELAERLSDAYINTNKISSLGTGFEQVADEARKWAVESLENIDPLEAKCDWEDNESIAYAVKKLLISRLKQ